MNTIIEDASGIGEMQQLLNKFNSIRERKTSEDDLGALTVVQPEKPPLVSVAGAKLPVAPHSNGHTTLIEITAEESPKRKSLSAQFLESKQKQAQQQPTTVAEEKEETNGEEQSRQVHIEHVDQHPPVEVAHHPSDLYPPEITAIDYDRFAHSVHEQVQIAGDGNPVRHSLLSLVSEEDVPLLLEAMAERFHFVFEDLINNNNNIDDSKTGAFLARPTASNLVKRGQPRRVDAKKNGVNGVVFATEPPSAFAYLDENGAVESDEWIEGTRISFDDYQRLCAEEREDYANKRLELLKWQASLISQQDVGSAHTSLVNGGLTAFVPSQLSSTEYELGVTNRFSYGDGSSVSASTNAQKNQPDRPSAVLGHSGDDSVEFRPINQEADSFSQVENASDLLF
uniref:Uncharacterized protein n=1 Tax=Plectus sambesii TaxID=2011161 RepID=A0A914WIQ7_9BILA